MEIQQFENDEYIPQLMDEVLEMAKKSYDNMEVAVSCLFAEVKSKDDYKILTKAHNLTTSTQNATMHCEVISINYLKNILKYQNGKNLTLYVSCEPCIMCAAALGIFGIKKVYFGCKNDKFGGNGSIMDIHKGIFNSIPYQSEGGYKDKECSEILRQFYERGNENLEESQRHRKKKKQNENNNEINQNNFISIHK